VKSLLPGHERVRTRLLRPHERVFHAEALHFNRNQPSKIPEHLQFTEKTGISLGYLQYATRKESISPIIQLRKRPVDGGFVLLLDSGNYTKLKEGGFGVTVFSIRKTWKMGFLFSVVFFRHCKTGLCHVSSMDGGHGELMELDVWRLVHHVCIEGHREKRHFLAVCRAGESGTGERCLAFGVRELSRNREWWQHGFIASPPPCLGIEIEII